MKIVVTSIFSFFLIIFCLLQNSGYDPMQLSAMLYTKVFRDLSVEDREGYYDQRGFYAYRKVEAGEVPPEYSSQYLFSIDQEGRVIRTSTRFEEQQEEALSTEPDEETRVVHDDEKVLAEAERIARDTERFVEDDPMIFDQELQEALDAEPDIDPDGDAQKAEKNRGFGGELDFGGFSL